jgi:3-hydroxybutyryl-CoA dehydratase
MTSIRKKTIEGLKVNDTFSVTRTFTEEDMLRFADISKDYNPVHFDEPFARGKGFRGRICHGLLVAGLMTQIGGQIGWLAAGMDFQFKRPVYFGDTVCCTFTIVAIDERRRARAQFVFKNQDGITVLEGAITGVLPDAKEKAMMQQMTAEKDSAHTYR